MMMDLKDLRVRPSGRRCKYTKAEFVDAQFFLGCGIIWQIKL